jgi:hypothetical protein
MPKKQNGTATRNPWATLVQFAELFYGLKLKLRDHPVALAEAPRALSEWESLTHGHYLQNTFRYVAVERVTSIDSDLDPRSRAGQADPPFPTHWLRVATDNSGHSYYFVDGVDHRDDPPVWHWDEECALDDPSVRFERLSEFLTWLVVNGTCELEDLTKEGPLGCLSSDVTFTNLNDHGPEVRGYVRTLPVKPWSQLGDLEIVHFNQELFLVDDDLLITLSPTAYAPLAALISAEDTAADEARAVTKAARTQATEALLHSKGLTPEGLLEALEGISGLRPLEKAFLRDFRMYAAAGTFHDGQLRKAAEIIEKHRQG